MLRKSAFLFSAAVALLAAPAAAQMPPLPTSLEAHQIAEGVFWVSGGSSNSGFIIGETGVIVIDAQKEEPTARLALGEIAERTSLPVQAIILTHGDPDHVGGLPAYPAGIAIIEHENTRAAIHASAIDPHAPPIYAPMYQALDTRFRPTDPISGTTTRTIAGVEMQLIHVAPGHSSGDIAVYLPAQRVVFAGDLITPETGDFPIVHIGGSSAGWIAAVEALLALDADFYVSGHGEHETRDQIRARLDAAIARRAEIARMVEAGSTVEQINAALPPQHNTSMFPNYNETTYNELVQGYPTAVPPWANIVRRP